jgi:phage RecT family recombinase
MTKEITLIKKRLEESPLLKEILGKGKDKYILNILSEISKNIGDDKKDLTKCTTNSIVSAIKQACDLNLEIDARQHCHLIKYGNTANLQIGYRGYIYAIKRAYPDANIDCSLVYENDDFTISKEGDRTTYKLNKNNPFSKEKKIVGGFCYISYTAGDRLVSFIETIGIDEINKIKACAKNDCIWKSWFEEKAKVAIIKRACKVHFSGINQIAEITEFDNKEFDVTPNVEEMKQAEEIETIEMEQALELVELIKKAGKDEKTICEIYGINTIIDLPLDKFETLKNSLNAS